MRCPVVIGRDDELSAIAGLVARGCGTALVFGEPGIGKSRLVDAAADAARASGRRVVTSRATPVDVRTPYRPIVEALASAGRGSAEPSAAVATILGEQGTDPVLLPPVVVGESVIRALTAAGPGTLLVVEDLHWADPDSAAVVEYVAAHSREAGLVVLATTRPPCPAWASRQLVLELPRLDEAAAGAMARALLGRSPNQTEQPALAAAAGLPLLIEDLLADGTERPLQRYEDLVAERVEAIDVDARLVLESAAFLGERVSHDLLREATGLEPVAHDRAVVRLVRLDLVASSEDGVAFRHALTRDAVLALLSARRAEVAARAARALESVDGPPGATADAWMAAGVPSRALAALDRGAGQAVALGALATAEALLQRGHELAPPRSDARGGFAVGLARVLEATGQSVRLLDAAPSLAADLTATDDKTDLECLLVRAALAADRLLEARAHLRVAHVLAAGTARAAETAILDARVAFADTAPDRVAAADHLAAQAIGRAREAGDPALECEAIEVAAVCARTRDLDAAERLLLRGQDVADRAGLPTWRLRFLNERGAVELLRDGRADVLEVALAEATAAGALGTVAGIACNLASHDVMTGDWEVAETRLVEAASLARRLGLRPLEAASAALTAVMWACRGRRAPMEAAVGRARALGGDDADGAAMIALATGVIELVDDDRTRAAAALNHREGGAVARTLDAPAGPARLLGAMDGTVTGAELALARQGIVRGARWAEMWQCSAEAVAAGPTDPVAACALRARAVEAGRPTPLFAALALRQVAEAALRNGWGEPVAWLQEAREAATELGLPRVASACGGLLQAAGVRPSRGGGSSQVPETLRRHGVTAREYEVLGLVGDRMQNREIADVLFLSPRTVEKHVASLLAKCGTSGRAELVTLARQVRTTGSG